MSEAAAATPDYEPKNILLTGGAGKLKNAKENISECLILQKYSR